jgi:hypothetical protein
MKNLQNAGELLGYVGGPELHDAVVVRVDDLGEEVRVIIKGENGETFLVSFSGVKNTSSHEPEGMTLYGMAELKGEPGLRRFVFVNWDEDDPANLEVSATGYSMERA